MIRRASRFASIGLCFGISCAATLIFAHAAGAVAAASLVTVYPAPEGEPLSKAFQVHVNGKDSPVYIHRVAADGERRWKAMDDKQHSDVYCEEAAFTTFDFRGPIKVTITCPQEVQSIKVLPTSFGVPAVVKGRSATLSLQRPMLLTVEINGDWVHSLHVFANPPEVDPPQPNDPNVIYFGPGVHEVKKIKVPSNKTVYLAGGAVVRGENAEKKWGAVLDLVGDNITVRGRGILDGRLCPLHSCNLMHVQGSNVRIEGIVLRDSSVWTLPIRKSNHVTVDNIKLLGYRANSDGIDICNSQDVTVSNSFLRTLDDLIVIKTPDRGAGKVERVRVKNCVLWNEVAHALSIGAELRDDVRDVVFSDCDVIHDKGREWALRVFHCDAALISNIRWENIRIEETKRAISLWIGKAIWSKDAERGQIRNITFQDITVAGDNPRVEFKGFDDEHRVQDVLLQNVKLNGQRLTRDDVKMNRFVDRVKVRP